ncbi:uncharacterized protein LY89DRAFT_622012 [Mollisia scopiformis]|uniref:Uncharacterized protein n=1 Tax=Mollisia scopiformis TaxID=149040 RepID=A0A194WZ51_MOLSC|nr:uncharacterized protein LY89DRAFT_622012 [Mollisia scopiformis]KUJ13233.1 hypothetical protein LY89DRAFT_622012 [Mollisia scopiformis]
MQLSKIIYLLFASTALSATTPPRRTSTSLRATSTPAAKVATPRVLKPATPPTMSDIKNSLANWNTSVYTVNAYLNDPQNTTKLASATVFAKDEPVQLATMMKVAGLSTSGVNAGKILMGNFGSIVSNLDSVQSGAMSTNDATAAVNFNRCCTVLPAIGMLWQAAATATKVGNVSMPALEEQCGMMSCASGVSGGEAAVRANGSIAANR